MTTTYDCIATTTLTSATSIVTFSSISGSFTDLVLICSVQSTNGEYARLRLNGDTNTNYSARVLDSGGSSGQSYAYANINLFQLFVATNVSQTSFNTTITHINNYYNTTNNKTILSRGGQGNSLQAAVGMYRSTAAITSLSVFQTSGTFTSGSTFSLYGIKAE